jgi:hypothetical protein
MIRFAPERILLQSRWMPDITLYSAIVLAAERHNSPT